MFTIDLAVGDAVVLLQDRGDLLAGTEGVVVQVEMHEVYVEPLYTSEGNRVRRDYSAIGYSTYDDGPNLHRFLMKGAKRGTDKKEILNDPGWLPTPDQVDALAHLMICEILDDIESGAVPYTVGSFSELHEYVDANMYGERYWDRYSKSRSHLASVDLLNAAMEVVNVWLGRRFAAIPPQLKAEAEEEETILEPTQEAERTVQDDLDALSEQVRALADRVQGSPLEGEIREVATELWILGGRKGE